MDKGKVQQFGTPTEIKLNPANDFVKELLYLDEEQKDCSNG